jgi:kynurenine formamidase
VARSASAKRSSMARSTRYTYFLAQAGVPIIEVANLEELARDGVYEFAFIAASLKFRGASAAPFRPIALPLR